MDNILNDENSNKTKTLTNSTYKLNQINPEKEKNKTIDTNSPSIIINNSKQKCLNNTNFTICIIITETNKESCIPECYLNCQNHFPEELEQNYCLLNVCKCEILKESININKSVNKNEIITDISHTANLTINNYLNNTSWTYRNNYKIFCKSFDLIF